MLTATLIGLVVVWFVYNTIKYEVDKRSIRRVLESRQRPITGMELRIAAKASRGHIYVILSRMEDGGEVVRVVKDSTVTRYILSNKYEGWKSDD